MRISSPVAAIESFRVRLSERRNDAVSFRQCCANAVCTGHDLKNLTSFHSRRLSGLSKGAESRVMGECCVISSLKKRLCLCANDSGYAAKSSLDFSWPCSVCGDGCFIQASRSVTSTRAASLDASSGVRAPERRRHDQLPTDWLG